MLLALGAPQTQEYGAWRHYIDDYGVPTTDKEE